MAPAGYTARCAHLEQVIAAVPQAARRPPSQRWPVHYPIRGDSDPAQPALATPPSQHPTTPPSQASQRARRSRPAALRTAARQRSAAGHGSPSLRRGAVASRVRKRFGGCDGCGGSKLRCLSIQGEWKELKPKAEPDRAGERVSGKATTEGGPALVCAGPVLRRPMPANRAQPPAAPPPPLQQQMLCCCNWAATAVAAASGCDNAVRFKGRLGSSGFIAEVLKFSCDSCPICH